MTDDEYEHWAGQERERVKLYLESEGIQSPNVQWPAFDVPPYFAIWAVESKRSPGKVGWWAFSGDCPTDYVSEDGSCHPRNALKRLLQQWQSYLPELDAGRQPAGARIGTSQTPEGLGKLLESRITLLTRLLNDDERWADL